MQWQLAGTETETDYSYRQLSGAESIHACLMDIKRAVFIISLTITGSIAQTCPERDPDRGDCQKSCTPNPDTNGGCRIARKCECDGTCGWSCIRKGCQSLSAPANGSVAVNPVDRSIGSTATFTCNYGLTLQGTPTRTCQENKTWSEGDDVSCECIRNEEEMDRLDLSCGRQCRSDGTCAKATFSCTCDGYCGMSCIEVGGENYCNTSHLIASHATYIVDPPTAGYGSIAQYTCNSGFSQTDGSSERTCTGGRSWNGSAIVCWPNPGRACFDPPLVENARHNGTKDYYLAGEILVYQCNSGYYRGGSLPPLLMCRASEGSLDWTNFDMTCIPKSCGPPDAITNGRIEGSIFSFLSSVTYVCDIGYRIDGLATRYCQSDQQWSGSAPRCNKIDDSERSTMPQDPANGRWVRGTGCQSGQLQFPGCELSYTCNAGYEPANSGVVYVASESAWDRRVEPLCQQALCTIPQDPSDGQWITGSGCQNGEDQPPGCQLSYTCSAGFIQRSTDVTYVCEGPTWHERELPLCRREDSCDNSNIPEPFIKHESEKDESTKNDGFLRVTCGKGFKLCNGFFIICKGGIWNHRNMFCGDPKLYPERYLSMCH